MFTALKNKTKHCQSRPFHLNQHSRADFHGGSSFSLILPIARNPKHCSVAYKAQRWDFGLLILVAQFGLTTAIPVDPFIAL